MMEDAVLVPSDIKRYIVKLYSEEQEQLEAMEIMRTFHDGTHDLNVGPSQYCRAILTLAENNINELRRLANVPEDPRDIIMRAEAKLGNPKHYFIPPFADKNGMLSTIFPQEGGARIMAIFLTIIFAFLFLSICYVSLPNL